MGERESGIKGKASFLVFCILNFVAQFLLACVCVCISTEVWVRWPLSGSPFKCHDIQRLLLLFAAKLTHFIVIMLSKNASKLVICLLQLSEVKLLKKIFITWTPYQ